MELIIIVISNRHAVKLFSIYLYLYHFINTAFNLSHKRLFTGNTTINAAVLADQITENKGSYAHLDMGSIY